MNNGLRHGLGAIAVLAGAVGPVAYADGEESLRYVAAHGAAAFTKDSVWNSTFGPANSPTRAEMQAVLPWKTGWGGGGAIGRKFGDNWRLEAELFWRQAKPEELGIKSASVGGRDITEVFRTFLESAGVDGRPAFEVDGRMKFLTLSFNGFYDFPTPWAWRPYVGIGAGIVRRTISKHVEIHLPGSFGATADTIEDEHETKWDFSYQFQVGIGVQVSDSVELEMGYRHKVLPNATLTFFEFGEGGAAAPVEVELTKSQSVDFGMHWAF